MADPTVNDVILSYTQLRAEKERAETEHQAWIKQMNERLKKLEAWLHIKMHADGVNSFATDAGTAYTSTVHRATVSDMRSFLDYVKENEEWDLLEKRVSKSRVQTMLDEGKPLPPGVAWNATTSVNVRKASER